MPKNVSTVVAIATLGAGLVHLAVGAGAVLPLLVMYLGAGLTEMAWGVAVLRADRVPAPRAFVAVALAPMAVWAATVTAGFAPALPIGPLAAASLLGVASATVVAVSLRRARHTSPAPGASAAATPPGGTGGTDLTPGTDATAEHPWRFLGTLAVSAAVVAGIVTPALSGTWAGRFAEPHGSHDVPVLEIETGGHAGH